MNNDAKVFASLFVDALIGERNGQEIGDSLSCRWGGAESLDWNPRRRRRSDQNSIRTPSRKTRGSRMATISL